MDNFKEALLLDREKMIPYFIMLSMIDNIGHVTYEKLKDRFESPREIFNAGEEKIAGLDFLTKGQRFALMKTRMTINPDKFYENMIKKGIDYISCEEERYPTRLREIYDCPTGLFFIGKLPPEKIPCVGVIGARECSYYGEEVASYIGEKLGNYGIPVVSGMARGIDSLSQLGAIKGGGTSYAVLGGGVDVVYPKESRSLYEKLKENGGIISEYPPGIQPQRKNFVRRNRLISAFSDTLCVIEAKKKSGTLITVDYALEQGKDVVAVPGRITDRTSVGCNELIRQGAEIVNDPEEFAKDVLRKWGMGDENVKTKNVPQRASVQLSFLEQTILNSCGDNSFVPEELLKNSDMQQYSNIFEIMTSCMTLSYENLLINMGGGRFRISGEGILLRS